MTIESVTLEVTDPTAAQRFYTADPDGVAWETASA
jgi:hypothetical protein